MTEVRPEEKPAPVVTPQAAAVAAYISTPSRETSEGTEVWSIVGMLGATMLLASLAMWATNIITMSKAATALSSAPKPTNLERLPLDIEQPKEKFQWGLSTLFGIAGFGLMLAHAARERASATGRTYGLTGLGMIAFAAMFLAYAVVADSYGNTLGLIGMAVVGLLMLGLFLQPLIGRWEPSETTSQEGQQNPLVVRLLFGAVALLLLAFLAYLANSYMRDYAAKVNHLKDNSILAYGLMPTGLLWLGLGLTLTLIHTSQERESEWRQAVLWPLGALGLIAAALGLGTVFTGGNWIGQEALVMPYGLIFGLVGLALLWATFSRWEGTEARYQAMLGLGAAGAIFFLLALGRSLWPPLREYFAQEYDLPGYLVPHGFVVMILSSLFMLVGWGLASENRLVVMTRRELAAMFYSPIAYMCLTGIGLIGWLCYFVWVRRLAVEAWPEPIVTMYLIPFFTVLGLTVIVPTFTMRLLSEERRSGTIEMMLTAPVTEAQVVLSKFLGVWLFSMFCFGMWLVFPLLLRVYGQEEFDYRPLLSYYLGLGCFLANFLAMGLFCSSLTRSQIVAFLLALAGMLFLLMPFFLKALGEGRMSQDMSDVFEYVSYFDHMSLMQQGQVHLKHLVFHLSLGVFWLFVTMKVLEARKWQ
jgi:ABC-2 type transport system permease protein